MLSKGAMTKIAKLVGFSGSDIVDGRVDVLIDKTVAVHVKIVPNSETTVEIVRVINEDFDKKTRRDNFMSDHHKALIQLAEVFGEDKNHVVNIKIEAPADRHMIVQIHRIPSDKEVQGMMRVLRRYEMVKRGEHFSAASGIRPRRWWEFWR